MRVLFTVVLFLMASVMYAQEKSPFAKFGKITQEHLQKKIYAVDSSANAVVLSDIGEAAVEGNSKGWFSISFVRHRVVHILNKNGYDEANIEVPLYTDGDVEEKLTDVKAVTYNLENGKVVEMKLEKSAVFTEKRNKNLIVRKFTFPHVKEGSIIEYEYKVMSDVMWNLDPWYFQGSSPVIWSEFILSVPQFFTYTFISHGYHSLHINERKDRQSGFTVADSRTSGATERISFNSGITDYRWVMKDLPALKEENFTSTLTNHTSGIEFQLSSQNAPLAPRSYRNTWTGLTKELLDSEFFGGALNNNNGWMSEDVKPLLAGATDETEKARKLFAFVRDNFTCTDHSALGMDQSLKNVLKAKKGNVAEINLLLTAMLKYADLKADPIILSTTGHGYAVEMYPMISRFNYVICQVQCGDKTYYLDASRPRMGFGKLPLECYNGHARIVNNEAGPVYFSPDSVMEKKVSAIFLGNVDRKWAGNMTQTPGYYESQGIRSKIKESGEEAFFKEIQKEYGEDVKIRDPHIDSLSNFEQPLCLIYQIELGKPTEDVIYINPMFGERWKKNPFVSAQRYYPVEMPYTMDETVVVTLQVPDGYVVDEIPKQIVAKTDDQNSAYFEYRISYSGSTISMRSRIRITRTFFSNEEYEILREFFNLIVNKHNEQIVFKKKN